MAWAGYDTSISSPRVRLPLTLAGKAPPAVPASKTKVGRLREIGSSWPSLWSRTVLSPACGMWTGAADKAATEARQIVAPKTSSWWRY